MLAHFLNLFINLMLLEDCPAGQERNATGVCMPCGRGNWRDILEDDCQPCDVGWTTRPEEVAVSKETCSMGQYFSTWVRY